VRSKSKWKGTDPIEEVETEEPNGKGGTKHVKWFVYQVVQPSGRFLRKHLPQMDERYDWHKLWRDMLWAIPRGNPQSRIPYEQLANGDSCQEGQAAWQDLVRFDAARAKGAFRTAEVAGSLWLGAQAVNAEAIRFVGRVEHNLLLHFWPLTGLVFVPQVIDNDGESQFAGYALAIPEVSRLDYFCDDFAELLGALPVEVRGFRPAGAVIDLPDQAALELLESFAALTQGVVQRKGLASISAVEFLHLIKVGKNVKLLAAGRIAPEPSLLVRYLAIAGTPCQQRFRNPLFRAGLLSLLRERKWFECLAPQLAQRPWPFFIRAEGSPPHLPWFWADAAKKFEEEEIEYEKTKEMHRVNAKDNPALPAPQAELSLLIHRLVRAYILRRTEDRSQKRWDDFKDKKKFDEQGRERIDIPKEYLEAREKVASDLFLGMRSRREQDFVRFFTDTVCSCKQFLPEGDFLIVAKALIKEPEIVKTLAMLAASANS
jgi:CRISPR-associated protein Cmx8